MIQGRPTSFTDGQSLGGSDGSPVALFVATRAGVTVGRVAAIHDRRNDEIRRERAGFFGFFECVDDRECAAALLATAEGWARERGAAIMRGPVSPSMRSNVI